MNTIIKNINFESRLVDFKVSRINESLKPWQVTGLADGEGAFVCTISETGKGVTGKSVSLEFKVTPPEKNRTPPEYYMNFKSFLIVVV
jgi:hypothetical protein